MRGNDAPSITEVKKMNLLNLNIPGITKDKDDQYYFQGEMVDSISISIYKSGSINLLIDLEAFTVEDALRIMEKFEFNEFKPSDGYMRSEINLAVLNHRGQWKYGMSRFSLELTVYGEAKDALINQGKLISINCDGEKTLELID